LIRDIDLRVHLCLLAYSSDDPRFKRRANRLRNS
jgi:hypothetical protein